MNTVNQARTIRYNTVKTLLDAGTFNKLEAQDILKGELVPGDEGTLVDDSALLDKTQAEVDDILSNTSPSEVLADTIKWFKIHKPEDRSEIARRFAIVITDLEKVYAFAKVHLE